MLYGMIQSLWWKNCPQSFSFDLDYVSGFLLFGQFLSASNLYHCLLYYRSTLFLKYYNRSNLVYNNQFEPRNTYRIPRNCRKFIPAHSSFFKNKCAVKSRTIVAWYSVVTPVDLKSTKIFFSLIRNSVYKNFWK